MYWGATDRGRPGAEAGSSRLRRLVVIASMVLLVLSGTVAMASAATSHPSAAAAASHVGARTASFVIPSADPPHRTNPPKTVPTTRPPAAVHPTTTTTVAPVHKTVPLSQTQAVAAAVRTRSTVPAAPALAGADTCGAALAYLAAHSAPGFGFECPGYALGHQAMTCINVAGVCPGAKLIVISVVCPASYMNEAHNSWVLSGLQSGSIDPYGYCP